MFRKFKEFMGKTSSTADNRTSYRNYDSPQHQHCYHPYAEPPQHYPADYYPSQNSNTNSNHYHRQFTVQPDRRRFERTYSRIADEYATLEQVSSALADAGLESSNLIVGIDFTKSNEWTGKKSFNGQNLHHISVEMMNPYEQAIDIIGRTPSSFDEDNLIPCFGFGDSSTHDQDVFSFYSDGRPCDGFGEVLSRYREIVPQLKLSGPTSFAPIIEMAMTVVEKSGGQHHLLVIIADGQVTRSGNAEPGRYSFQERQTIDAIARATEYPLSIVLVGVGDGPLDMMKEFDDHIPQRAFDNFHFVNFTEIMLKKNTDQMRKEREFALAALMQIPLQYRATLELGLLGPQTGRSPAGRIALPTPNVGTYRRNSSSSSFGGSDSNGSNSTSTEETSSPSRLLDENERCPICWTNTKDMAFGCGHRTCCHCGVDPRLSSCPICRRNIEIRIKLL